MGNEAVRELGYLRLEVGDLEKWHSFATEVLGFAALDGDEDDALLLRMDDRHHRIALSEGPRDDLAALGLEVSTSRELKQLAERLSREGCSVRNGTAAECDARRVVDLVQFQDPNGVICEAYCGGLVQRDHPFRSPRGIDRFVTDDQGLGHIVMMVDSLEESLRFYCDLLGFRLSDWVRPQPERGVQSHINLAFLHCNRRHHSIAFWEAPGAPKRLHHFMVQTSRFDDVGRTYDLCQDRGVPIELTLGRHTNDEMVSFYMGSPSGFWVEWGWGAREIDDRTWHVALHTNGSSWGHRRPS